jgi:hypothetical protein
MKSPVTYRTNERGNTPINTIIAVVVIAVIVYVAITIVPIYTKKYDIEDRIKGDVKFAFDGRFGDSPDAIQKRLAEKIYSYLDEIKAVYEKKPKNVLVKVIDPSAKKITVTVVYSMPHKVPFFPTVFTINLNSEGLKDL